MPRYFTLQEASETLETIHPIMDEIQSIRQEILLHQPEFWPAIERSAGKALRPSARNFERVGDNVDGFLPVMFKAVGFQGFVKPRRYLLGAISQFETFKT